MDTIGTRELDPRLKELFDAKKNVYSISKLNCVDQCEYQAYITYILHERGGNNCYGIMGTKIHDILEAIMNNEATESDLLPALESELADMDMLGIGFPNDRNGGNSIRDHWVADMTHFCNNFVKPKGNFTTEELIIYKISDDRFLQGYIDLIKHHSENEISIYDWKTSSQFSKETLLEHGRQLIAYAMAKEAEGYKIRHIAWIMLKYVQIEYMGKSRANSKQETLQTKIVERYKIAQELQSDIENRLYNLGYEEVDVECFLHNALEANSLDGLPESVRSLYTIKPYVREYEYTDELKQELLEYINATADSFESKSDVEDEWKPKSFTKTLKSGKEVDDSFFCQVLCSHKATCKHLKKYNDLRELGSKNEDEDLF